MKDGTRSRMVLLGAGASVDAGVPAAFDMSRRLRDAFSREQYLRPYAEILDFVTGALLAERGERRENPYDGVDVERLFNAINILADPRESELHPFVRSLNPKVSEFDQMNQGDGRIFRITSNFMLRQLIDVAWIEYASKVAYLDPLLRLDGSGGETTLVTLNYDNSIELAASTQGIAVWTGIIDTWSSSSKLIFGNPGVVLLKLHGSIDWVLNRDIHNEGSPLPHTSIRRVAHPNEKRYEQRGAPYDPAIIFGGENKLTAEGPFLDLLREFNERLSAVEELVVVGYSFRDPHVDEGIRRWMNGGLNRKLTVISPRIGESPRGVLAEVMEHAPQRLVPIKATAAEGIRQVLG